MEYPETLELTLIPGEANRSDFNSNSCAVGLAFHRALKLEQGHRIEVGVCFVAIVNRNNDAVVRYDYPRFHIEDFDEFEAANVEKKMLLKAENYPDLVC